MDRRNNFDLLRLGAATSVIFSHAFLLAEGTQDHEPLYRLTGGQSVLGVLGVFVFFTISGYLVSESWERTGSVPRFLAKRVLRIWPGLIACVLVCALALGPAFTSLPWSEYVRHPQTWRFVVHNAVLEVEANRLPGVWFGAGDAGGIVDGPLWSLPCEALMYAMLAGLGALGLLRLRVIVPLILIGLGAILLDTAQWPGALASAAWLLAFFAMGMALQRVDRAWLVDNRAAALAAIALVAATLAGQLIIGFALFGSYLVLWAAFTPLLPHVPAARFGDLSYGLYIYGWPAEQMVVALRGGAAGWPEVFALALVAAAGIALLSWHLVEKPALRLKPASPAAPARATRLARA